jgi:hypothetical protein
MKKDVKIITTIVTTHTLVLISEDLKDNLIKNFLDVINGYVGEDDLESLKSTASTFNACLNHIIDNKWSRLFNEGYTAMLLAPQEFDYIDNYFLVKKKQQHNKKLKLKIESLLNEKTFFVCEEDINY